jgi:hypothetical protein
VHGDEHATLVNDALSEPIVLGVKAVTVNPAAAARGRLCFRHLLILALGTEPWVDLLCSEHPGGKSVRTNHAGPTSRRRTLADRNSTPCRRDLSLPLARSASHTRDRKAVTIGLIRLYHSCAALRCIHPSIHPHQSQVICLSSRFSCFVSCLSAPA